MTPREAAEISHNITWLCDYDRFCEATGLDPESFYAKTRWQGFNDAWSKLGGIHADLLVAFSPGGPLAKTRTDHADTASAEVTP